MIANYPQFPPYVASSSHLVSRARSIRGDFFSLDSIHSILAPKKKLTKFQTEMATSIDDLKTTMDMMAQQLAGVQDLAKQFEKMMTMTLDKLNDLEAWRSIAETSMGSIMQQSKETTTRVQ